MQNKITSLKGIPSYLTELFCHGNSLTEFKEILKLTELIGLYCPDFLHLENKEGIEFSKYRCLPIQISDYLDILRTYHEKEIFEKKLSI